MSEIRSKIKSTRYFLISTFLCGSAALGQTGDASAVNGSQSVIRGLRPPTPLPNGGDNSAGTFLSGRVAIEDGSVAPRGIAIELVCSNFARTVASTDGNGRFTFQFGGAANVSDASASGHQKRDHEVIGVFHGCRYLGAGRP